MADTRKALADLGRQSINEETLVEAGIKTVRDEIRKLLASKGISNAIGFKVELVNGQTITIASEQNPAADTPMSEVKSVRPTQSARAGLGNVRQITVVFAN